MIAIPLDSRDSTTLSELYGKAPFFALLDTKSGSFKVLENEEKGKGPKSAEFLKKHGATSTIFYHMGDGVYKSFVKNNMKVYSSLHSHYSIDTIYTKALKADFEVLDENNYKELLDPGDEQSCSCGCEGTK